MVLFETERLTVKSLKEDDAAFFAELFTDPAILKNIPEEAVLFGLIGLCFGIYYSIGGMFIDILVSAEVLQAENWDTPGLTIGTLMTYMALVAMPLFAAICGFALGLVEGLLYNLFRKWVGKLDFKLFD